MIQLAKNHVGPLGKVDLEFVQGDFRTCQLGKDLTCRQKLQDATSGGPGTSRVASAGGVTGRIGVPH